ncbi:MAG: ORF6N domain-containing protein, partial [Lachnospiraceae bacterium]|nr:ORF6N domain-containing protein [Lachnospiraceae bacterium]
MAKKNTECELETEVLIIDENYIKNRIYMVRGQKVMLDYELAEIYGYTTTR